MEKPSYRREVAQIVYLSNWLSPNIPKLEELRKPFSKYANLEGKKLIDIERKKRLNGMTSWTGPMKN
eukprot:snap_masked-scaffold_17-processed-gene-5.7-mRNA-1 protein AED:1.00 eAED:1.00 QI:0/-1/0/0/-1/1/1/0/66